MISYKNRKQIDKMRKANLVVGEVLQIVKSKVRPGITTMELEREAQEEVTRRKVKPAFKGYRGFPYCLCVSVNEEVVHGMPSTERVLEDGDIVSIDFGVELNGFFGDSAITVGVGTVSDEARHLMDVTSESLDRAIEQVRPGKRIADISLAVQSHAEGNGFSVVRNFVGHGIGKRLHEEPQVPNFLVPGYDVSLAEGMVLAIEPMINAGGYDVEVLEDGWTAVTTDRSLSAHFEHSVAVTSDGPAVLSRV